MLLCSNKRDANLVGVEVGLSLGCILLVILHLIHTYGRIPVDER